MAATSRDPLARLEVALARGRDAPVRRLLMIVNPYATTVSDRLTNLIVHALRGSYDVHTVETEGRGHATELCRRAAQGYDVVVVFGGDGTVNEAANGLAASTTPLSCLPGGRANVFCRILGIPADVIDATEHLLRLPDDWRPRRVDVGEVNGRCFVFAAGAGLDASVVARVDAHPRLKARLGEWYYTWTAIDTFSRRYLLRPRPIEADLTGARVRGITVIVQNATPYTYFGDRPVQIAEGATLDSGDLAGIVLGRTTPIDVPTIMWRALSRRARLTRHTKVHPFAGLRELTVRSLDGGQLPIQVDGDYIGSAPEARFNVRPGAIAVIS